MTPPENAPLRTNSSQKDPKPSAWALAGLGMQFAGALLLFGWIGQWVDRRFGTEPFGLLVGVLLGGGGFFALLVRRITKGEDRQ